MDFIRLDLNLEIRDTNTNAGNKFFFFFFFFLNIKKLTTDTHFLASIKKRIVKLLLKLFTNNLKIMDYTGNHSIYVIKSSFQTMKKFLLRH